MTFADFRKDLFYNTTLVGPFAKQIIYSTPGAPDRVIWCRMDLTAVDQMNTSSDSNVQTALVSVGRDESHALGGVERAGQDDTLLPIGDDPASMRFAFTGEIVEETPHSLRLKFTREVPFRIGKR